MSENSTNLNPNAPADANAGIYGLPFTEAESKVVFIPVPWEVTTSYGGGTANGPEAILKASPQIDLYDPEVKDHWQKGLFYNDDGFDYIQDLNKKTKPKATQVIAALTGESTLSENDLNQLLSEVNNASHLCNEWVRNKTLNILKQKKIPALIGGDHSVPFGAFQAAAEVYGNFGILHLDAHSDTRHQYMGFEHSHASILRNALDLIPNIKRMVQVGIRDYCDEEAQYIKTHADRIHCYTDLRIQNEKQDGIQFSIMAHEIIKHLPDRVWITFDIDGLDPKFCPNTGTPVPGGLDYYEAISLMRLIAKSGRQIIGFDLVEVAPAEGNEWDANVAMRLLYKMSAYAMVSQGHASWRL